MFVNKQAEVFQGISTTQNEFFMKSMQTLLEEQRKWDAEMMNKEHNFLRMQMNTLMDGFLKGLQTMQQYQYVPSFQPTVHSFPGSSAHFLQTSSMDFMHNPSSLSVSRLSCNSSS